MLPLCIVAILFFTRKSPPPKRWVRKSTVTWK